MDWIDSSNANAAKKVYGRKAFGAASSQSTAVASSSSSNLFTSTYPLQSKISPFTSSSSFDLHKAAISPIRNRSKSDGTDNSNLSNATSNSSRNSVIDDIEDIDEEIDQFLDKKKLGKSRGRGGLKLHNINIPIGSNVTNSTTNSTTTDKKISISKRKNVENEKRIAADSKKSRARIASPHRSRSLTVPSVSASPHRSSDIGNTANTYKLTSNLSSTSVLEFNAMKTTRSGTTTSKKRSELNETINDGHIDDMSYLYECISKYNDGLCGRTAFHFMVHLPPLVSQFELNRLMKWLQNIGFEDYYVGDTIAYKISITEIAEIQRILSHIIARNHFNTSSSSNTAFSNSSNSSSGSSSRNDVFGALDGNSTFPSSCLSLKKPVGLSLDTSFGLISAKGKSNFPLRNRILDNIRDLDEISEGVDSPTSGLSEPPTPFSAIRTSPYTLSCTSRSNSYEFLGTETRLRSSSGSPSTLSLIQQYQSQMRLNTSNDALSAIDTAIATSPPSATAISIATTLNTSLSSSMISNFNLIENKPIDISSSSSSSSAQDAGNKLEHTPIASASADNRLLDDSLELSPGSPITSHISHCGSPHDTPLLLAESTFGNEHSAEFFSRDVFDRSNGELPHGKIAQRQLRRSKSMPIRPSQAAACTPIVEVSMSQNDVPSVGMCDFQTPQSIRFTKYSGKGDDDWGKSQPVSASCIRRMDQYYLTSGCAAYVSTNASSNRIASMLNRTTPIHHATSSSNLHSTSSSLLLSSTDHKKSHVTVVGGGGCGWTGIGNDVSNHPPAVIYGIPSLHMTDGRRIMSPHQVPDAHIDQRTEMDSSYDSSHNNYQIDCNDSISASSSIDNLMMDLLDSSTSKDLCTRDRRRIRNSISKLRRLSFGASKGDRDIVGLRFSLSPCMSSSQAANRSRKIEKYRRSLLLDSNQHMHQAYDCTTLNESNFFGVIVGATYQHCFHDGSPVVAPPSASDKHFTGLRLNKEDGSLEIKMYIPTEGESLIVRFDVGWKWLRASPKGFLVMNGTFKSSRRDDSTVVADTLLYYLPKHPYDLLDINSDRSYSSRVIQCHSWFSYLIDTHGVSSNTVGFVDTNQATSVIVNWNQNDIITSVLEFLLSSESAAVAVATAQEASCYRVISKSWSLAVDKILARALSSMDYSSSKFDWQMWARFVNRYDNGCFVSRGACKEVYSVLNAHGTLDAVSVMNIRDLTSRGMEGAVAQELEISMLCSSLNTLNICPNLVQIHSVFTSEYAAPDYWGQSVLSPNDHNHIVMRSNIKKVSKKSRAKKGCYQYIRMEFCKGGDVEGIVRECNQLEISTTRTMLFQMCFSLYASREQLGLRHYDIKLLNFFAATGGSLVHFKADNNIFNKHDVSIDVRIGLGREVFTLPLALDTSYDLVKLADFGTSFIGNHLLGTPITVQQFTTLENTPPEFLLLGSNCRQSFSSDTFCLGLCFLHLVTGHEPYEELLKDVKCPAYMVALIQQYWITSDEYSPYYMINELMETLDYEDGSCDENIMYDTLYRYMVLFGVPDNIFSLGDNYLANNDIWKCLVDALGVKCSMNKDDTGDSSSSSSSSSGDDMKLKHLFSSPHAIREHKYSNSSCTDSAINDKLRLECRKQFKDDRLRWSVHFGNDPIMVSARQRLTSLGSGAIRLLEQMVHLDPARRCTMLEAMFHPIFVVLREVNPSAGAVVPPFDPQMSNSVDFQSFTQSNQSSTGVVFNKVNGDIQLSKSYRYYSLPSNEQLANY